MTNLKKIVAFLLCSFLFIGTPPIFASEKYETASYVNLVISFKNNIDPNVESIVRNSGGEILNELPEIGGIEVKCSPSLISTIKSLNSVDSLTPNHPIKLSSNEKSLTAAGISSNSSNVPEDLYQKYQWDIQRITKNGKSFDLESGNHDIVVGIIDSGVDTTHPDLIKNFLGGKNFIPANFKEDISETGDINDIHDRYGHGTNVAGFIAANGRTKGVAPNIGFKSYRVFNKDGDTDAVICSSAIISAANDDVNVINLSMDGFDLKGKCYWTDPETGIKHYLGDNMAEYSLLKKAVKYALNKGITVVSAAGNDNQNCADKAKLTNYLNELYSDQGFQYNGLTYEVPGTIKNVITVSATGKDNTLASYSNYGKDFVNISAPGGDLSDTFSTTDMCFTTSINSGYTFVQGTSFSAPKVSAIAALILCKNKELTPKKVAKIMYKNADIINNDKSSEYYGAGMANAYNTLKYMIS